MKLSWKAALAATLALAPLGAAAQSPAGRGAAGARGGGEVVGQVVDGGTGQPIASAAVSVYADSALVGRALTTPDGRFDVRGLRPGTYRLRIEFLGYAPRTVARVSVAAGAPALVGRLPLSVQAVALEGVTVEVARPPVEMRPDRTIYDPKKLGASRGGAASDVLQTIPGVDVDPDGNVSLHGSSDVKIQINGRPSPLTGAALADFLKQLPASTIKSVEVLPNPSAKYDPEGSSGAINIVLDRQADLGWSGGVDLAAGSGGRFNEGGHLAYQAGRLTLAGNYGLHDDRRPDAGSSWRENLLDPVSYLDQTNAGLRRELGQTLNLDGELRLGKKDVLTTSLMGMTGRGRRSSDVLQRFLDAARSPTGSLRQDDSTRTQRTSADAVVGFTHSFVPEKHTLAAELRYNRHDDSDDRSFLQQATAATAERLDSYDTRQTHGYVTGRLDYVRSMSTRWKVQAGYEGDAGRLSNDYVASLLTGGVPAPSSGSNAFRYAQDLQALYGILGRQLGAFGLEAGLRAEHAATRFDLTTTGQQYDRSYNSLYPSGALMWKLTQGDQLRLSYSRRVHRPHPDQLNPFPVVQDPLNRAQGNPYLRPEYTNALQLEYQRHLSSGSLQLAPFYRRTNDVVRGITLFGDSTGIATTTFQNLATATSYGADLGGSMHLARRLQAFANLSAFHNETRGGAGQAQYSSSGTSWSLRGSLNWTVRPGTELHWFAFYRAPMTVPQGRIDAFSMSDFSVRQQLWNERTSVALRVADPFDSMHFAEEIDAPGYLQRTRASFSARALYLTFRYAFGQKPRLKTPDDPTQQQATPDTPVPPTTPGPAGK